MPDRWLLLTVCGAAAVDRHFLEESTESVAFVCVFHRYVPGGSRGVRSLSPAGGGGVRGALSGVETWDDRGGRRKAVLCDGRVDGDPVFRGLSRFSVFSSAA